jgi:hypothetical protein
LVDQIEGEEVLCTLGPLAESMGGECAFDDELSGSTAQADLRPYIDQVHPFPRISFPLFASFVSLLL